MTKSAFLTLAGLVFCLKILAQPCLPDGIVLTTQSEVNNFKANHPGCTQILGSVLIENTSITNLDSLDAITEIGGSLSMYYNPLLQQINGLKNVDSVGQVFSMSYNPRLKTLAHLDRLSWVGSQFFITNNDSLTDISALGHLRYVGEEFRITDNPQLADCGATGVCRQLQTRPDKVTIHSNAPGCNDTSEILGNCTRMAQVRILTDPDGDCLSDAANQPAQGVTLLLDAPNQHEIRPCGADGRASFAFTDTDPFTLSIQQFPSENWAVCQNNQSFDPANLGPGDTLKALFLLKPLRACAQLDVHLGLPSEFPADCSATAQVSVFSKNIGTTGTLGLQTTLVFPAAGFDLLQAEPPVFAQNGDTLIFQNAGLEPFAQSEIRLTVRSKCAGVEPGRTFCWEAFSTAANVCPLPPSNGSEIEISATCEGDSVLFQLKNTGVAATSGPHVFKIIKNKYVRRTENFSLAPGQTLDVKVSADGATWRMEATRRDDGTRTAVSFENCGGLKPGLVSAFWQDRGAVGHDFDCRQTVATTAALFPALTTAIPAGVGATKLLAPGQAVQYTLRFQNTEPDTARRVVLRGQLAAGLNPATFRPLAASHPFDWVILEGNNLELTFPGIALPDSSTDLTGSRGFFSFDIAQMPGLDSGAVISQHLSVQFENGPVLDSSYTHSVGEPLPYGLSCAPNGITFHSQNDVDRFQADYPGCIHILGQVVLSYTDAQNLNALDEVESVGPLHFSDNYSLTDLSGLSNLNACQDLLILRSNLSNLHGLENLTHIPESVVLQYNYALTSLEGLNRLDSIGQNFLLDNSYLSDLTALSHLKKIGGSFELIGNGLNLHALDSLETIGDRLYLDAFLDSLFGLERLRDVGGDLVISSGQYSDANFLPILQTIGGSLILQYSYWDRLEGFAQLQTIGHNLSVADCSNMLEITAFQNLQRVGQSVSITRNPQLLSFNGLQNLQDVGADFIIRENPALLDLASLGALQRIGRNMSVENSGLSGGINGLNALERIGGELSFRNNPQLMHLNGFQNLKFVGDKLLMKDNQAMVDLPGLVKLDTVGGLYFDENPVLQNLNGLQSLRHVDSLGIFFHHNPFIENFDSLQNLHYIGGDLHIESNYYLRNMNGLRNLDSLAGSMFISTNANLTTLGGFEKLKKINGGLEISHHDSLALLDHLNNVRTVGGTVRIFNNPYVVSFSGLSGLEKVGQDFHFQYNGMMSDVAGLSKLDSVGGEFYIGNTYVTSLHGLENLRSVGHNCLIEWNEKLENLSALSSLATVGGSLSIISYNGMDGLDGLENLTQVGGSVRIMGNDSLTHLNGLNHLANIPGDLFIVGNRKLSTLDGLAALQSIGGELLLGNDSLSNVIGLTNLVSVGKSVNISECPRLTNLSGLSRLETIGQYLKINFNPYLTSLTGLENLKSVGYLQIARNDRLTSLGALGNLQTIALELDISDNPLLSACSVFAVCDYLQNPPGWLRIENNGTDCNTPGEVAALCHSTPVQVTVLLDLNGNCQPDAADLPLNEAHVHLASNLQMGTRPTDVAGMTHFKYLDNGAFSLTLPQFPTDNWEACTDPLTLVPGPIVGDTVYAMLLLLPKTQCPELTTRLELPSMFRGCLAESELGVFTQNTGAVTAENVRTALIVPPVIEVLSSVPPASAQSGDTLFFDAPLLLPFKNQEIKLRVHTRCDTFLFGQTLCWEAFSTASNTCPITTQAFSEIRVSAECLADTALRFTLVNVGDAPTVALHQYVVYQNITPVDTAMFSLAAHETVSFNLPADGATYRVEATKLNNGTLTARSLENCGGLTSGLVTAFWLEKGAVNYDFDCRQVVGSFDPNQKTAVPTGIGSDHLLEKNQPLQYTIDFQNTGNDTAFRVLLRDVLPENLNVATIRPGLASHPYSWQIRGLDTLEVLFQPIALPDSNVNEPRSHGFFSFEILQKNDLSDGTTLENTAEIVFDYNPPIVTNTVRHTIGRVVVRVDELHTAETLWQVLGNPTCESAVFLAKKWVGGEKRFELFDASGRAVRRAEFSGQSFDFQRNGLAAGLYFFKIHNENGRVFSGKIVISD